MTKSIGGENTFGYIHVVFVVLLGTMSVIGCFNDGTSMTTTEEASQLEPKYTTMNESVPFEERSNDRSTIDKLEIDLGLGDPIPLEEIVRSEHTVFYGRATFAGDTFSTSLYFSERPTPHLIDYAKSVSKDRENVLNNAIEFALDRIETEFGQKRDRRFIDLGGFGFSLRAIEFYDAGRCSLLFEDELPRRVLEMYVEFSPDKSICRSVSGFSFS